MRQINLKVKDSVAESFSHAAKGLDISQRQLFEDMLSMFISKNPASVEKGKKINEMEKRIRGEG